ncbi:MAG: UV DNA damage repair endonuclease UvsE, partial [Candidatus Pacebacteria bacterium]|nr:UV DNA damage repair endonuclease UvsE [Candidatus Paceibacterota bacterium]
YNIQNDIHLFRISSDVIPFGCSPVNQLDWWNEFSEVFNRIGSKIQTHNIRVSMHPGQYTVLNSPSVDVVARAFADLAYHARVLDCLGSDFTNKIILHIGGVYGNKQEAMSRFIQNFQEFPAHVKKRIVIENDDKCYHIRDVLTISQQLSIPAVFDNLHNFLNPSGESRSDEQWIELCRTTWKPEDGPQKIHYSQQDPIKKSGSHSFTINVEEFLSFYQRINRNDLDFMLEVKDKNLSALKIINCLRPDIGMSVLETTWERYKYKVLEHSPEIYLQIRELLKDKKSRPILKLYQLIDSALNQKLTLGHQINAILHIWGYFKNHEIEKNGFQRRLERVQTGELSVAAMKKYLHSLAVKYDNEYLISSLYFAF